MSRVGSDQEFFRYYGWIGSGQEFFSYYEWTMIAPGVSRSLQIRPLTWSNAQLSYFILFHFVSFCFIFV